MVVLVVVIVPEILVNVIVASGIGLFPASATRPETENEAGAMKLAELVAVPSAVTTVIGPVVTPTGTVATICVVEFTVKEAFKPLNRTALGVMKFVPSIVTQLCPPDPSSVRKKR